MTGQPDESTEDVTIFIISSCDQRTFFDIVGEWYRDISFLLMAAKQTALISAHSRK